jgi:hypothetical protein
MVVTWGLITGSVMAEVISFETVAADVGGMAEVRTMRQKPEIMKQRRGEFYTCRHLNLRYGDRV